ncbi:MAG: TIGR01777 family oxidoreductase [Anaerolineae bacterium]
MRVIITGGTGMIGQALAADLARDGHDVVVLTRDPARVRGMSARVRAVGWDGRTAQGWAAEVEGAGAIVNLAGQRVAGMNPFAYRWTDARRRAICESRRDPGLAVTAAVEAASEKPGVVVQVSGVDYYAPTGEIAREDSPPGDGFMSHICAVCWEPPTAPVEALGVRRVVARMGPVLHPGDGALPPLLLQSRLFVGGRLGSGRQWFSWVHIADVVAALRFLIDTPEARGVFNLCAPNPVRNAALSETIGRVLGRPSFMVVPAFAMRLLYGAMADTLLKGVRALPGRLQELGYRFKFPELEPALRDLLGR